MMRGRLWVKLLTKYENALWKAALVLVSGMVSNPYAAIIVPQIKAGFVKKDYLLPISSSASVFMSPLQTHQSLVCREEDTV
ncbi:hypothetical protein TNCV_2796051 [Trichonephila clavipes]|nr:hypothetical protein TNCV_2796051 [Trichonephila clavipes]